MSTTEKWALTLAMLSILALSIANTIQTEEMAKTVTELTRSLEQVQSVHKETTRNLIAAQDRLSQAATEKKESK